MVIHFNNYRAAVSDLQDHGFYLHRDGVWINRHSEVEATIATCHDGIVAVFYREV